MKARTERAVLVQGLIRMVLREVTVGMDNEQLKRDLSRAFNEASRELAKELSREAREN